MQEVLFTTLENIPKEVKKFIVKQNRRQYMAKRITVKTPSKTNYDIVMTDSFQELPRELEAFSVSEKKLCIITDSNVGKIYAEEVAELLKHHCREVHVFIFPAGEENKHLNTVQDAYRFLITNKFDRKDMLIALGGGVVGDLTGYTAATYLRGVDFIQIPTTLLSQVDSSIGGKTGVDFDRYKNMVGAFHMPCLVYMNLSVLKTLDDRQYACGMAEILKHGLIKNASYYEWLITNFEEIESRETGIIEDMIYESCLVKKAVVEKDPTEKGERALLNFGHTLGHAIEKYKNFTMLHGECVALGCVAAAYISWKREMLSDEEFYEIRDMFVPFSLPISVSDINPQEIIALTKADKKMEQGKIKFILLKKIGKAVIDNTVTEEEMQAALQEIIY